MVEVASGVEAELALPVLKCAGICVFGSDGVELFEGFVEASDVAGVVFGVVDAHGLLVDDRFEGVVGVGEFGEGVLGGGVVPAEGLRAEEFGGRGFGGCKSDACSTEDGDGGDGVASGEGVHG